MADDDDIDPAGEGGNLANAMDGVKTRTRDLTSGANAFARAMTGAFARGATGAKRFDDVLKSLALRLSTMALQTALKPLTGALGGGLDKLFGDLGGGAGGGFGGGEALTKALSGAEPFAAGGVIATPSFFALPSRRLGLAGEAGPEAILPLARGADGRLGVAASGGAAASVTIHIHTPDAESFRRSETYLTGLMARAVARGQRGM
jgi:phage-related minor tail protein